MNKDLIDEATEEIELIKSVHAIRDYIRTDKNLYNDSLVMKEIEKIIDAWNERECILDGRNEEYNLDDMFGENGGIPF